MKRELREELSIVIGTVDGSELQINKYDDGGTFEVMYFFVSKFEGTPVNNVFEEIRWVPLGDLRCFDMLEGNRPIVDRLTEARFRS